MASFLQNIGGLFGWGGGREGRSAGTVTYEEAETSGLTFEEWLNQRTSSSSGMAVNSDTSRSLTAIYSAQGLISETIAALPLDLKVKGSNGWITLEGAKHPMAKLLEGEPNEYMSWFTFWQTLIWNALDDGNGYAYIERDSNMRPIAMTPLHKGECQPYYQRTGIGKGEHYLYYYVFGRQVEKYNIFHIKCVGSNGVIGKSPITQCRDAVGLGLAQQDFSGQYYKNGISAQVALEHPTSLMGANGQSVLERLRTQWAETYSGKKNRYKPLILEEGMKVKELNLKPSDLQFIESRKFQIDEIARIYRVPLPLLQSLDKATLNNMEQLRQQFRSDCIQPWTTQIEAEMKRKLLAIYEKSDYKYDFDEKKVLQSDTKSLGEFYRAVFGTGAIDPNDIRREIGLNEKEHGNYNMGYVQMQQVPVEHITEIDRNGKGGQVQGDSPADSSK